MNTKKLLSIAIIAALPMVAHAQNISGAMYTAPSAANNDHPAPTTNANAPFGRIDIDTTDQDHIASTAYVKGAYNSAIAAVNKVKTELTSSAQSRLHGYDDGDQIVDIDSELYSAEEFIESIIDDDIERLTGSLITAYGVAVGLQSQRAEVYTNWDDDTEKIDVAFKTVVP